MNDLEVIEYLLQHPAFKGQVLVSDKEISSQFKWELLGNQEERRRIFSEVSVAVNKGDQPIRCISRIYDEIFIPRTDNNRHQVTREEALATTN